ncbi:MAG: PAS domain-containing protein [Erythrobacter sp.]|nr:PAS domain-containing protein [Erythrobacter sp.]
MTEVVRDMPRVRALLDHGPVQITSHKRNEFVMMPQSDYERLTASSAADARGLEDKLELVLESVSSPIMIMDSELRVRRVNKAFLDYFSYTPADVIGHQMAGLAQTAGDNYILICTRQVLESGKEKSFEMASSHREGRFFRFTIRPWPGGVALFADDITEQSRATEHIMQELARDQASKEIGGIGSGVVDANGTIRNASLGLAVLLGVRRRLLIGASLYRILSPECREPVERCLQKRGLDTETLEIDYLASGAALAPAKIVFSPFSSGRFQDCNAFIIQDCARCGESPEEAGEP